MKNIVLLSLLSICFGSQVSCQGQIINKLDKEKTTQIKVNKEIISDKDYQNLITDKFLFSLDSSTAILKINDRYKFVLENRKNVVFQDKGKEDDLDYRNYSYLGSLNNSLLYFSADGYETNELFIFNIKNGIQTELLSFPFLNQEGTYFFTFSNNSQVDYLENKVNIYSIDNFNRIKKVASFNYEDLFPVEMFWISKNEIVVKFLMYRDEEETFKFEKWKFEM